MHDLLDLDAFPVDRPQSAAYAALVARCRDALATQGMFNLDGFMLPAVAAAASAQIEPLMATQSFEHRRSHNIYFADVEGLPADHPALRRLETVNHTLCADQLAGNAVLRVYEYEPLHAFLADAMGKPRLHPMADPLARVNVMAYRDGEALNWHFDRSEFTTTLLLQAPDQGGAFEYRAGLRSPDDPNYEGVAALLEGRDEQIERLVLAPGTLNVFAGRDTAHRVTPVRGPRARIIAVFSYYERPGVRFSDAERIGFYGRAA